MSQADLAAIEFQFPPGSRVRYVDSAENVQAEGIVSRVEPSANDAIVTVNLDGVGELPILSRFLERV